MLKTLESDVRITSDAIKLNIKISQISPRRFRVILSSRKKDNSRVSSLNTNKGDSRVC